LASFTVSDSPIVVGISKSWVYLYGLVVIRDGLVILAFCIIGSSPIVIGISKSWVYLYGLDVIRDVLVILAFISIGSPRLT